MLGTTGLSEDGGGGEDKSHREKNPERGPIFRRSHGVGGKLRCEELFSRCVNVRGKPSRKRLMARAIKSFVKKVAEEAGLDLRYFSARPILLYFWGINL